MFKMISNIEPVRAAIISIVCASIGTINKYIAINVAFFNSIPVDTALQRLAWSVAILAVIVAIINGSKGWFKKKRKKNENKFFFSKHFWQSVIITAHRVNCN